MRQGHDSLEHKNYRPAFEFCLQLDNIISRVISWRFFPSFSINLSVAMPWNEVKSSYTNHNGRTCPCLTQFNLALAHRLYPRSVHEDPAGSSAQWRVFMNLLWIHSGYSSGSTYPPHWTWNPCASCTDVLNFDDENWTTGDIYSIGIKKMSCFSLWYYLLSPRGRWRDGSDRC